MQEEKRTLRRRLLAHRAAEPERAGYGARIADRVRTLPEWVRADGGLLLTYVSVRDEVDTHTLLRDAWSRGLRVAVPVVRARELDLVLLARMEDLALSEYGLLEPRPECRGKDLVIPADLVDLLLVPGVGFDRAGGRLGYGGGYFDRLLGQVRPSAAVIALAFECQLVDRIPMGPRDVRVPIIVTERAVYRTGVEGRGGTLTRNTPD